MKDEAAEKKVQKDEDELAALFDTPELDVNFDTEELKSRLDAALNTDPAKGRVLPRAAVVEFSDTPPALLSAGVPMAKIISRADTIRKIRRDHDLTSADMTRLPQEYAKPVFVFKDGKNFVVVTAMKGMTKAGVLKPVEVFLRPAGESEGRNNYIASAYAREPDKEQEYLRLARMPGSLLAVDKTRAADIGLEEATYSQLRPLTDNGSFSRNIIPQSASGNKGASFDTPEISPADDAAYMDAVKRGDMETAQRMVREAAARAMPNTKVVDADGKPMKIYHGSRTGANIKIFKTPTFFTDNRDVADMFKKEADFILRVNGEEVAIDDITARQIADELTKGDYTPDEMADWGSFAESIKGIEDNGKSYGGRDVISDALAGVGIDIPLDEITEMSFKRVPDIYECYINIEKPLEIDFKGKTWGQEGTKEMESAVRDAAKNGHDGVIVRNIREGGFLGELRNGEEPPLSTDYIPINPSQIKSSEVTRDDAGNVIPLSQRFDQSKADINFDTQELGTGAEVNFMSDELSPDEIRDAIRRTDAYDFKLPTGGQMKAFVDGYRSGDSEIKRQIIDWAQTVVPPVVNNRYIGEIHNSRNTTRDILHHVRSGKQRGPLKVLIQPRLGDILRNAVLFEDRIDNGDHYYNLAHRITFEDEPYFALVAVKDDANGKRTWTVEFASEKKMTETPATGQVAPQAEAGGSKTPSPSMRETLKRILSMPRKIAQTGGEVKGVDFDTLELTPAEAEYAASEDNTSGNNVHAATVTAVDVYKTSDNADGEIDRNEAAHSVRDLPYGKITDNKIAYFLGGVKEASKVVGIHPPSQLSDM